jgi:cytidylate kinase
METRSQSGAGGKDFSSHSARVPAPAPAVGEQGALSLPRPELFERAYLAEKFPFLEKLLLPGESLGSMYLRLTNEPLIITIDGPGAVGKGTVGEKLARYFGVPFFSSGITYRVPALVALAEIEEFKQKGWVTRRRLQDKEGVEPLTKKEKRLIHDLVRELVGNDDISGQLHVENHPGGQRVIVERGGVRRDVTDEVYVNPECSTGASILGEIGIVRRDLLPFQRSFGRLGCVTDGRDMGTTVFPDAPIKLYFGGAPELRALWRQDQRLRKSGQEHLIPTKFPETEEELATTLNYISAFYLEAEDIESRDRHDKTRRFSPLREPKGAIRFYPAEYTYTRVDPDKTNRKKSRRSNRKETRLDGIRSYSEQETFEATRDLALAKLEEILKKRGIGI